MADKAVLFDAGFVVRTPGALLALIEAQVTESRLIERHLSGDFGELCEEGRASNRHAISEGGRIVSSYQVDAQRKAIEARSGKLMIVPLSQLVASPDNVRKTNGTDVSGLKASIEAQGVLQNLIVCSVTSKRGKPTGQFEVVGGKRRLQALMLLAEEGKLARDEGIVCRVKPSREAAEARLAENHHREQMHPADEFEAFHRLVQEGRSVEDVALRFGTSPLTVRRRLKLAGLHPTLIQLYREDGINLER